MIAKLYDLNITKYQNDSNIKVQGATYKITEEEEGDTKTQITNSNGELEINKLLLTKTYKIQEIKTSNQYELNTNIIRFKTEEQENGEIKATLLEGDLREGTEIHIEEDKIYLEVEDIVKPNIKIIKYDKDNNQPLSSIKYRIKGKGLPPTGSLITTNENGEGKRIGLFQNEEYTLEEVKANEYYLNEDIIKFKILNNNGTYSIDGLEGNLKSSELEMIEGIPTIVLEIENEKKPVYNLQIIKTEKGNREKVLEGAKFKLYKNNEEIGQYTSNAEGIINIEKLNLYKEEKANQENGLYKLKEVKVPQGYIFAPEYIFRAQKNNETDELELKQDFEENKANYNYEVQDNTIKLYFENNQTFRLTKKDGETEDALPNTKFVIYNYTNGIEETAYDSKNNIVGEPELIDGKEYYVVTTDENGQINKDLPEGYYKLIEVKTSNEKYKLLEDYYFGIGTSSQGEDKWLIEKIFNKESKNLTLSRYMDSNTKILKTEDDGYITTTISINRIIIDGKTYESSKGFLLIEKYNSNNEREWKKILEGTYKGENVIIEEETKNIIALKDSEITKFDIEGNLIETKNIQEIEYEPN